MGRKRLHKKPARRHVEACRARLEVEIRQVDPAVVVCLGGSAAEAILGHDVRVMSDRGIPVEWNDRLGLPTIHPSYVLRSRDEEVRRQRFGVLVEDLSSAAPIAQR